VYILHQTLIIVIAYFVIQWPWAPWSKYWMVLVSTLVACVLLYEGLIRRFAWLRLLFGIKPKRVPALPAAPASLLTSRTGIS
jgi:glucan biosynthesis protein C